MHESESSIQEAQDLGAAMAAYLEMFGTLEGFWGWDE